MLRGSAELSIPSDIFLVCEDNRGGKSYQIWLNNKEDGFSLSQEGSLPSGVQSISFADVGMLYSLLSLLFFSLTCTRS